jgi:surfactin synthase thioesterase subunit
LEIPESVIENEAVFNEMLPALRADILLGKKYEYYEDEPLECPLTAFAGKDDSVFSEDQIRAWQQHTSNEFRYEVVNGSHLFCRDNKEELLKIVSEVLSDKVSTSAKARW